MKMTEVKSVLMVCKGNICRSPIAEGVFQQLVNEKGLHSKWQVDSAALSSNHIGKKPHWRSLLTMRKNGISYTNKAKQVNPADFDKFDYILGMDEEIISELQRMAPMNCKAKVVLLGAHDPKGEQIIRDPYFENGAEGFKNCYQQCLRSCKAFLEQQ